MKTTMRHLTAMILLSLSIVSCRSGSDNSDIESVSIDSSKSDVVISNPRILAKNFTSPDQYNFSFEMTALLKNKSTSIAFGNADYALGLLTSGKVVLEAVIRHDTSGSEPTASSSNEGDTIQLKLLESTAGDKKSYKLKFEANVIGNRTFMLKVNGHNISVVSLRNGKIFLEDVVLRDGQQGISVGN